MKILEILWSWPTLIAAILALYHKELRTLLTRVSTSSRAKFGSLEIEMPSAPSVGQMPLQTVEGQVFNLQAVHLDGKHFRNCQFVQSTLIFTGASPVGLENCIFSGVRWEFSGSSQLTLQFMSALYHGAGEGGRELIEKTFDNVRQGYDQPAA